MSKAIFTSRLYYHAAIFVLFFTTAAASFNGFYQKSHFREIEPFPDSRLDFVPMIEGTAARPFVYRQLLPTIANWAAQWVPASTQDQILKWAFKSDGGFSYSELYAIADSPIARSKTYFFRYLTLYITTFLFALLAIYALYWACRAMDIPRAGALFAPVILMLLLPYFMVPAGFSYDYSELAFFALTFLVALKFDWWWLIPLAALGTWNKESFLLFVPALYPVLRPRLSRTRTTVAIVVSLSVCAFVYLLLRAKYAANPGASIETHWAAYLDFVHSPKLLIDWTDETYGVRNLRPFTVLPVALLVWTVRRTWKHLSSYMRRHALIAAAINIPLFALFCNPGEYRDLSLLYITFIAILAWNINDFTRSTQSGSPAQPTG